MREIRVHYHHEETGNYTEIWKVVGKNQYVARLVDTPHGYWYTVNDAPYGYCELNSPVRTDVVFVICDDRGRELFRDAVDGGPGFPSYEWTCRAEWAKVVGNYPAAQRGGRRSWLRQFFKPEVKAGLAGMPCPEDNFCDSWYDQVADELISRFIWLGQKLGFHRVRYHSRYSSAEWYEYRVGLEQADGRYGYYAAWEPINENRRYPAMKEYLSILVTLSPDELAALNSGAADRVYRSVWSTVTTFLSPKLGKWFTSFFPSPTPWGQPAPPSPFGTVLGKVNPNAFRHLFVEAGAAQESFFDSRKKKLLRDVLGTDDLSTLPAFLVQVLPVDVKSETAAHILWLEEFSSGRLVPFSSLYCLPQEKNEMRVEEIEGIMRAPERFALCTVELYTEGQDEGDV